MRDLFDTEPPPLNELEQRYRLWRDANPRVLALFRHFAEQMLVHKRRFGVKALAERVRWEIRTTWEQDAQGFKINNDFPAYIAREFIREDPRFGALIETRIVREGDEDTAGLAV